MGILENGPFGHLNGKVGNLVSYTLNGKNVTRISGKTTKPPTQPKLAQYQRMAVINQFLSPMGEYLKLGFGQEAKGTSSNPYNKALSYNKVHALQGNYPDISVDYSKAMVSKGPLPPAISPAVAATVDGLELTWQLPADLDSHYLSNRSMIVVYFPKTDQGPEADAVMEFRGSRRQECRDFIALETSELNRPFEVYLAFISDDKSMMSDSVWIAQT